MQLYSLTVPEVKSPCKIGFTVQKSTCWQGCLLEEAVRGYPIFSHLDSMAAIGLWLVAPTFFNVH